MMPDSIPSTLLRVMCSQNWKYTLAGCLSGAHRRQDIMGEILWRNWSALFTTGFGWQLKECQAIHNVGEEERDPAQYINKSNLSLQMESEDVETYLILFQPPYLITDLIYLHFKQIKGKEAAKISSLVHFEFYTCVHSVCTFKLFPILPGLCGKLGTTGHRQ